MSLICGIDEAGRGALAGPLVVAGCVFKNEVATELADSKKLSEKKREEIFEILKLNCDYLTVYFDNKMIDKDGLSACLKTALIILKRRFKDCEIIFDGNCDYGVGDIKTLIKADAKVREVSAASIIAKVSRDRLMRLYHKIYPKYNYKLNKGYGTAAHIAAIEEFGRGELGRYSFKLPQKGLFDA